MARFGDFDQYLDNAGDPLVSGKIYFYESGTTTFKNTYSDINNSIANTNPVILTAAGRQPNIFFDGVAKAILATSADVQIAVRDPVGQTESAFGDQWVATKIYSSTDVVLGSDGVFYRSLVNANQNNNPVSTSGFWTLLYSVEWNAGITYAIAAMVTYNDLQYQSLQGTNLNQNPSTATTYWVPLNFAWLSTSTYALDQNVVGTDGILYTSIQAANTGNEPSVSALWWVGTSAAAAASAIAAAASAAAAAADAVQTGLDAAATAADAIATAADAVQTGLDAAATAADVILTNADAVATAADRVQTGLDAAATAADVIATAADAVQTGLDVIATNADVVLTNADVVSTNADVVLTNADVVLTAADASSTAADKIATNADVVLTGLDVVSTNADVVLTAADVVSSSGSASAAAGSAAAAATTYDNFDDRYLGDKASDPTLDNDGNPLLTGALYFNTVSNAMKVYTGSAWSAVAPTATSITVSQISDYTGTAVELNYTDGVTSNIQTQLDAKDSLPSQTGNTGKFLTTNGTAAAWETLTTDPTLGTLTQTFTNGQRTTINLTSSVLAPVVSVTKEVPQTGITNNNWNVNSTTENYTRLNSAAATTLDWVGFDISTASYTQAFSVSAQETSPAGVVFNTDGTRMFIVGDAGDDINQYELTSGFDISTASFTQSFSVSAQEITPKGIAFNTDGTRMFIVGSAGDDVNQYELTSEFDISTASYTQSFSVSGQEASPQGVAFNADGTKMFIVGSAGDDVNEYALSTGFDVSTASFVDSFSVAAQEVTPTAIAFNQNGTRMFIVGDDVNQYQLTSGFDVSTASYTQSFSVSGQDTNPKGIAFNTNGTRMFIVGDAGDDINQYELSSFLELGTGSFASADVGKTIEANDGAFVLTATDGSNVETTAPTSYDQVASGSWEMYGVVYNSADGDLQLSGGLINTFDVSTAVYSQSFSVAAQDTAPYGIAFNTDGTKMFIVGGEGQDVNEYTLSTGFDVSTASFVDSFSVSAQDAAPRGIAFNTDGTKMFIVGAAGQDVNEYTLSTGFDVSTASFVDSFSVAAQETNPWGIAFNADGTKMFVVGSTGDDVNEYTLSTGFDVSTASFVDSFSVAAQDTTPWGIAFSNDGTKMFILGAAGQDVNEYTLSTGFDVSTASFVDSFSVAGQDTSPAGLAFNNYGTKMFVVGFVNDTVYEYTLAGAFALLTGYQPVHTTASIDSTYWTDINSMTADQAAGDGNIYYAISTDDRTTWTVIDNTDGERDIVRNNAGTWQYNSNGTYASETWTNATTNTELAALAEAMEGAAAGYGLANASYDSKSFSYASQESYGTDIAFNNDGSKMYIVGTSWPISVYQYSLSTSFDVSTASYDSVSFSFSSQETQVTGLVFNDDGTKMFVVGSTGDAVYEYTLSTAYVVSSASYASKSFSVSSQDTTPTGIAFNTAGTKMYICGDNSDSVYQYSLSTAFDVSTASYDSVSLDVSSEGTSTRAITFNSTGTKLFVAQYVTDSIFQYGLSTAFDLSTASYDSVEFDISNEQGTVEGIVFNGTGTKLYVMGNTADSVFQYTTATYINQMDKTQLDAVTDPNHIALGNDLDLAIVFNMTSGTTVPSSDGVAINYDANVLNKGAILGTDYDFDAPATNSVRITALAANNLKVRVV